MIQGCGLKTDLDELKLDTLLVGYPEALRVSAAICCLTLIDGLPRRLAPPRNDGDGVSLRAAAKQSRSGGCERGDLLFDGGGRIAASASASSK